jgi:hypothetical protein
VAVFILIAIVASVIGVQTRADGADDQPMGTIEEPTSS